jgi:hypothetical protein
MNKSAIRLLVLVMFATAVAAVPTLVPAKAATDGNITKKKHKRASSAGSEAQAPRTSSQIPPNMADDPNRRVGY